MISKSKSSFLGKVELIPEALAALAIIIIVALETIQAISRYCFRSTFLFVDDIVVICFAWLVFAGAAAAYKRKMHYGLEIISSRIHGKARVVFELVVQVIVTFLMGYLLYLSIVLFINSGSKILFTTNLSYKWIDGAAVYGFTMMVLYAVIFLVQDIKKLGNKEQEAEDK